MKNRIQKISKYAPSIFQGRFEFASRPQSGRGISLTLEHLYERLAFHIFVALLCVLGCAYLYFVSSSVLNVMARKAALQQSAQLSNAIAGLEQQYFAASGSITPQEGQKLGLAPVSSTDYVYRPGNAASIDRIGGNEI